jgi:hypothetical protein
MANRHGLELFMKERTTLSGLRMVESRIFQYLQLTSGLLEFSPT